MGSAAGYPSVSITFSPAWWRARHGITFGEEVWADPVARTEQDRALRRLLYDHFGDVGLGEADPPPRPNVEAYGHRFMAAVWGCEIRYFANQAPSAVVLPDAAGVLESCRAPDLHYSRVVQRALSDARLLQARYGACEGGVNYGGPLNNAVTVLGEEVLRALVERPDVARAALAAMAEALVGVHEHVTWAINGTHRTWPQPAGGLGNCPVCMVSPDTYLDAVLPSDMWYRSRFNDFGIHHCGALHPYAEVYRRLRPCALDVGWLSDRRHVRRTYPETPMSLMVEASALAGRSQQQVDEMVASLLEEAGPASLITTIWVAEAGTEVADNTVRNFMTVMSRLASGA